jgi:hypothetical protein
MNESLTTDVPSRSCEAAEVVSSDSWFPHKKKPNCLTGRALPCNGLETGSTADGPRLLDLSLRSPLTHVRADPDLSAGRDLSLCDCFDIDRSPLLCRFIIADALKTTTRRGEIGTSAPVLGFRPIRLPLWRTVNVPNDDSLTISPLATLSEISFRTTSTRADDSERESPTFR